MTTEIPANLCHGMSAIGRHLGLTARQAKHLHSNGNLPTFKLGRIVCARRTDLDQWLERVAVKSPESERGNG